MQADTLIHRCLTLARFTEEPGHITRTFLSPPMREVHREVTRWMQEAGMEVWVDAAGNIRGIYGRGPRLMIGSHLDTVPHAGPFDGILGVMMGIALVEEKPPFAVEVVGFSEEEGVRFRVPFIGSRALVGDPVMDDAVLQAIRDFELDPADLPKAVARDVKGYLEFHIEQGPVLDQKNLPIGVVEAIVGQSRADIQFQGKAGHAGTTPMTGRCDALAAAAEWIGMVERTALEEGVVATVGSLQVEPGAVNVIPGLARASLDVRHKNARKIDKAMEMLQTSAEEIAKRRGVTGWWELRSSHPPADMNRLMTNVLAAAVKSAGHQPFRLPSGAGHDAMILARKVPAAMLFLRSPGGVSHHPAETVDEYVVNAALAAGRKFLQTWRPV